jgi:hypothetical protein
VQAALRNHPDKNGNTPESISKFQDINKVPNSSHLNEHPQWRYLFYRPMKFSRHRGKKKYVRK